MDFLLFQVLFAIIVVGLMIAGWLFVRARKQRRDEPPAQPAWQAKTPRHAPPEKPASRRAEGNGTVGTDTAHVRKRQIAPSGARNSGAPDSPGSRKAGIDVTARASAAADIALADEPATPPLALVDEPATDAPRDAHFEGGRNDRQGHRTAPIEPTGETQTEMMDLLEDAFLLLQREEISLADYIAYTLEQEQILAERIAALEGTGRVQALDDARVAQDSVRWCRQWAEDLARDGA